MEKLTIGQLIDKLEKIKEQFGSELPVATTESHDYWGTLYNGIYDKSVFVGNADIDGPKKSGQLCVIIDHNKF